MLDTRDESSVRIEDGHVGANDEGAAIPFPVCPLNAGRQSKGLMQQPTRLAVVAGLVGLVECLFDRLQLTLSALRNRA